jgi:4-hydroxybenzoate polyprenyltransferase
MPSVGDIVRLMRPLQWYKNVLVFVPFVFVGWLFEPVPFVLSVIAFVALCLVSSANYAVNDVLDSSVDRLHPEKRERPIASGRVSVSVALVFAAGLLVASAVISFTLSSAFGALVIGLFVWTLLYSVAFKREPIVDVLAIGVNFVARAVAGAVVISVPVSAWLVLCTFFLSLVLSVGKREAELVYLGADAARHRRTLAGFTPRLTHLLMVSSVSLLVLSYALFVFFGGHPGLFITLPLSLYSVWRFAQLVEQGSVIARHPEFVVRDARLVVAVVLWAVLAFVVMY